MPIWNMYEKILSKMTAHLVALSAQAVVWNMRQKNRYLCSCSSFVVAIIV